MESSAHLIPLVDDLTHILLKAGKNKTALIEGRNDAEHCRGLTRRYTYSPCVFAHAYAAFLCASYTSIRHRSRSRGTKNSSGCKEALNLLAPGTPQARVAVG